ncbi:hypothetical protein GCM10009745_49160 [Kribbella yunnanensis]|uniref:Metalloprotease n=1 Tax=Kribbella yunnanensis TaxID=190194 RepID=A0ABN2I1R6_9ACTN
MLRGLAVGLLVAASVAACGSKDTPAAVRLTPTVSPTPTPTVTTPVAVPKVTPTAEPTVDRAILKLVAENGLYEAGQVPVVRCVLPRKMPRTSTEFRAYGRVIVGCMDRAWEPVIRQARGRFTPIELVQSYDLRKPSASPECGKPPTNMDAFYRRGTICYEWPEFRNPDDPVRNLVDFQQLLAHEYGHHVQSMATILDLYDRVYWKKPSKAVLLENERRLELQASCLGAAFLGANRTSFGLTGERERIWTSIVHRVGDENNTLKIRDHGSYKSHAYWTTRAFASTNPATCNTFTAAPKRVS